MKQLAPQQLKQSSTQPANGHRLLILACLTCLIFALSTPLIAQTNALAPLPPAAQEAVEKGRIAARVPDYLLAIRYFEDARKIAPEAPIIFFYLGLAESKLTGRELRAISWLSAYLAAYPNASNAAEVSGLINVLNVRSQSTVSGLIRTVQTAGSQVPGDQRDGMLRSVAELWGINGDIQTALQTADLIQSQSYKSAALADIAWTQAEAGDIAGAQKTADLIHEADSKSSAQSAVAIAQVKAGDIAGAQNSADLIPGVRFKTGVQSYIAKHQAKGDSLSSIRSVITSSDWLNKLSDDNKSNDCPLNTAPFLDLAGYVKSLPSSDDPQKVFESFRETAEKNIRAQNVVDQMLKQRVVPHWEQADVLELQMSKQNAVGGAGEKDSSAVIGNGGEVKFAVGHYHGGFHLCNGCVGGYAGVLTILSSGVRFEETEKGGKPSHNFQISCVEIAGVERKSGYVSYANFAITLKSGKKFELRVTADDDPKSKISKGDDYAVYTVLKTISDTCKLQ